jgi:hypothetical protein
MKVTFLLGALAGAILAAPSSHAQWTPPIGIPMPPFGINEQAGPFTHYVDNTHPLATDSGNPNGSPALPRRTVPTSLAAGSRVEVRGGPYVVNSSVTWTGNGTLAAPVFVSGIGGPRIIGTPPVDSNDELKLAGTHFIVQGLVFDTSHVRMMGGTRLVFRFNEIRNYSPGSNSSALEPTGTENVVYGNHIHHNGNPLSPTELDIHGVAPDSGDVRTWIVDNHIHDNAGDSIQVGGATAPEPWARFQYIGRNEMHDDGENAVDIKRARDVVISQNRIYGYVPPPSDSDDGTAIVVHDMPDRVWVLFNQVSDSTNGIRSTGCNDGFYVIGNVVWNIRHLPGDPDYDPDSMFGVQAIRANATDPFFAINNTVFGSDAGISFPNGNQGQIVNNIVAGLVQPSHHVAVGSSTGNILRNNVFDATARIRFGSSTVRNCAQTQAAFPSQVSACINANPLLVNPGALDFHIAPNSPAVNAGLAGNAAYSRFLSLYGLDIARDADGTPRPVGPAFDIGAYEVRNVVSIADLSQAEGNFGTTTHGLALTLGGASPVPVQVGFTVTAGTATAGVDFVAATGTVTIPAFVTTHPLPVSVLADLMDEGNETYNVTLTSAVNATLGDAQAVGTILDDDAPPEVLVEDCGRVEGDAGSGPCLFRLALSAASSLPVSLAYATASGTATAGADFTAASGVVTFPPGSTAAQNVTVSVTGDTSVEVDEAFVLDLSSPQNATLPDAQGSGVILDDDALSLSSNELFHGWSQRADLAASPGADVDLYRMAQRARSSYEVVVDEVSGDLAPGLVLERLASDNSTTLQSAQPVGTGAAVSLRWQNTGVSDVMQQHLRIRSTGCTTSCGADDTYRVRFYDTTYSFPRFNNTGNSFTSLFIQNPTAASVNGVAWFWNASGALVYARAFVAPARGVATISGPATPALLGHSGSVTVTNDAPYGRLTGKASSIDLTSGSSFDIPMEPRPR